MFKGYQMMQEIDEKALKRSLRIDARGIGIPSGAANIFIDHAVKDTLKTLKNKSVITEKDLNRALSKELKKYNADLAYVYQNRDTII